MDLIPLQSGGGHDHGERALTLSESARKLARIRSVSVERRWVSHELRLWGKITYDQTRQKEITAWFPGRIDRMFVDYAGMKVRRGDHLYQIYSPDLITAHQELLAARRMVKRTDGALRESSQRTLEAVRAKLRRWGLSKRQVKHLEGTRRPRDHITLYAPQSGVVVERSKVEGTYVQTGTTVYRIADLDWVWVEAWAYEQDLPWLRFGQPVEFTVDALPGRTFTGLVSFIDPYLDDRSRATKVRVSVRNDGGLLKPGMFARVQVKSELAGEGRLMEPELADRYVCPMHPHVMSEEKGRCEVCGMRMATAKELGYAVPDPEAEPPLVIPVSAALVTGKRAVVYVELPHTEEPTYEGREIVLGPRAGDVYTVLEGLREGERVVVEGNFKLDSALQIQARPSMMNPAPASQPTSAPTSQPTSAPVVAPQPPPPKPTAAKRRRVKAKKVPKANKVPKPKKAPEAKASEPKPPAEPPPPALAGTVTAYLAMQRALASDDQAKAATSWKRLRDEAGKLEVKHAALKAAARGGAQSMESLRSAFGRASRQLISAVRGDPAAAGRKLHLFFCPMAFDNGAPWLQAAPPLRNPYFGAAMLSCGNAKGTLGR